MSLPKEIAVPSREIALNGPFGYPRTLFLDAGELNKSLICPLCTNVLRQAVVVNGDASGSVYCDSCIRARCFPSSAVANQSDTKHFLTRGSGIGGGADGFTVPLAPKSPADLVSVVIVRRKVHKLRVACHIDPHRCWTTGPIGVDEHFWRAHETECYFATVKCPDCEMSMLRFEIAAHSQFTCAKRLVTCAACLSPGILACAMDGHRSKCTRQQKVEAIGTALLAASAFNKMFVQDSSTVAHVVQSSVQVRQADAERTIEALHSLAAEYKAEVEAYAAALESARVERMRMIDNWRSAGLREDIIIQDARQSIEASDEHLARHLSDRSLSQQDFERIWQALQESMEVERTRIRLKHDEIDTRAGHDIALLAQELEAAGRRCTDAFAAWSMEDSTAQKLAEQRSESELFNAERDLAVTISEENSRAHDAVDSSDRQRAAQAVTVDADIQLLNQRVAEFRSTTLVDADRLAAAYREQDDRRREDLQRLHIEIRAGDAALAASERDRRDESSRIREQIAQSELRRRALTDRLTDEQRSAESERRTNMEKQIEIVRLAAETQQGYLRDVRDELFAAQMLHHDTEQYCASENMRVTEVMQREEEMRTQEVELFKSSTRKHIESFLISEAQRQQDVADFTARFEDLVKQQSDAGKLLESETKQLSEIKQLDELNRMLESYRLNGGDEAKVLGVDVRALVEATTDAAKHNTADATLFIREQQQFEQVSAADAAELGQSLAELAEGRKQDDAHVRELLQVAKSDFAEIVAKLAAIEKKFSSKNAKVLAAADRMRVETEETAAERQQRADVLAEALQRQAANEKVTMQASLLDIRRTLEQMQQSEFEQRADFDRGSEACRQLKVHMSHDSEIATESLRRMERERSAIEARRTEWVRRYESDIKNNSLYAQSEVKRLEEAFRLYGIERQLEQERAAELAKSRDSVAGKGAPGQSDRIDRSEDERSKRVQASIESMKVLLRETKVKRDAISNVLYKDREARIEDVFVCEEEVGALRKNIRELRARVLPQLDRMPPPRAPLAATSIDQGTSLGSTAMQNSKSVRSAVAPSIAFDAEAVENRPAPAQAIAATIRSVPLQKTAPSAAVATAIANASIALAMVAEASSGPDMERYHPGQWRVYRRLEYYTCCQTPSTGDQNAIGCQSRKRTDLTPK